MVGDHISLSLSFSSFFSPPFLREIRVQISWRRKGERRGSGSREGRNFHVEKFFPESAQLTKLVRESREKRGWPPIKIKVSGYFPRFSSHFVIDVLVNLPLRGNYHLPLDRGRYQSFIITYSILRLTFRIFGSPEIFTRSLKF